MKHKLSDLNEYGKKVKLHSLSIPYDGTNNKKAKVNHIDLTLATPINLTIHIYSTETMMGSPSAE